MKHAKLHPIAAGRATPRRSFALLTTQYVWLCAGAALLGLLPTSVVHASWMPSWIRWPLGLTAHWHWLFVAVGLSGAVVALRTRRRRTWLALPVILGAWLVHLPAVPNAAAVPGAQTLRVATANINYQNEDAAPLVAWLMSSSGPDVLVLTEFTPAILAALEREGGEGLRSRFPHRVVHPRADQFGIAVFSRLAVTNSEARIAQSRFATPVLRLELAWAGRAVLLTAVHPMPPISPGYADERDASTLREARRLAESGKLGVMAGDFNDTPWSASMRRLGDHLQRASGLTPTWPNAFGLLSVLPLDHVLVTKGFEGHDSRLGPDLGSDHRPLVVELSANATPSSR